MAGNRRRAAKHPLPGWDTCTMPKAEFDALVHLMVGGYLLKTGQGGPTADVNTLDPQEAASLKLGIAMAALVAWHWITDPSFAAQMMKVGSGRAH